MIITITLNPALDRTIYISDSLVEGGLNFATKTSVEPGGKGINVSRAIRAIGSKSVALGFSAGANGRFMKDSLTALDIHHDFVDVPGETRVNVQIIDANELPTSINEPGAPVTAQHFERFLTRLEPYLDPHNIFVISGSVPPGFDNDNARVIFKKIKDAGCSLIVNASKYYMDTALEFQPDYVKQTKYDLYKYLGQPVQDDPEQIAHDAMVLIERGAKAVCISLMEDGAVFLSKAAHEAIFVVCEKKNAGVISIGSGDAMVAAIANGMDKNLDYVETAKFTYAAGRAAARLPGTAMPTLSEVFKIHETVLVYSIFTI